mgnify:CR=1 FL=1
MEQAKEPCKEQDFPFPPNARNIAACQAEIRFSTAFSPRDETSTLGSNRVLEAAAARSPHPLFASSIRMTSKVIRCKSSCSRTRRMRSHALASGSCTARSCISTRFPASLDTLLCSALRQNEGQIGIKLLLQLEELKLFACPGTHLVLARTTLSARVSCVNASRTPGCSKPFIDEGTIDRGRNRRGLL